MASTPLKSVVFAQTLTTDFEEIYKVPNDVARFGIDAAVFNNFTSAENVAISVKLVRDTSNPENEVITNKLIRKEDSFLAPALIGQAMVTGDSIRAKADFTGRVTVFITGTEITG